MKETIGGVLPPLGVACLAAYLSAKGYCIKIIDSTLEGEEIPSLLDKIGLLGPGLVGLSSLTAAFTRTKTLEDLKRNFRGVRMLLGF